MSKIASRCFGRRLKLTKCYSLSLSLSFSTKLHLEQNGYVEWDKVDIESIDLPPSEDKYGIPSSDDEEDVGTQKDGGAGKDGASKEEGVSTAVIVDNLPQVPEAKFVKLTNVLTKIFGQIGQIRDGGLHMPMDPATKMSCGYAFIEFATRGEADAAVEQADGYKLDKAHVFKVSKFDDFEKYAKVPDEYVPPEPKPYSQRENTQAWMMDERGRDQFVCRFGDETEIFWNDAQKSSAVEEYKRSFWTESYVQWSPRGTYLATVHRQGVALWGGPSFGRLAKFSHSGVQFIEFSPCERYLCSGSAHEPSHGNPASVVVNFFDIATGQKLRQFSGAQKDFLASANQRGFVWPIFKWNGIESEDVETSSSSKNNNKKEENTKAMPAFFARLAKDAIQVYKTPEMTLLDKKSVKLPGVSEFCWSLGEPILATFQPEQNGGNVPARISLIQLPSRNEVRSKNLFNVSDVKMFWQSQGDYFAVKVDHHTKSKKSTYSGFELFRLREPMCPMEVLALPDKSEKIVAFAWEPKGHRFAIIHGDGARPDVSFYSMIEGDGGAKKVHLLKTLKSKTANHLFWSPNGSMIVLAGLKTMNGQFEFFNVDEMETMATCEHFMATDVEWDPTGRYVTTAVTGVHQMENGYHTWTFNGRLLYKQTRERFFQFLWRPRGKSLLLKAQEADIKKNLKKYSKKFEEEDERIKSQQATMLDKAKQETKEKWEAWMAEKKRKIDSDEYQGVLKKILGVDYAKKEAEIVTIEEEEEEIISVVEEPL